MNECKDCKHECQKCEQNRFALELKTGAKIICQMFTSKIPTENTQDPLTMDEIIILELRLSIESCEFCINNQNQIIKAITMTLQNQPEDRPALERGLLSSIEALQNLKEKETDYLLKLTEIEK